ncbi:NADH-quinone oxidoreductase subunit K [Streptomyces sp. DSM 42041]|uniref:NADH-quinone oxidoreductase subunit K n=1 Tax=Streptomyces hazeniae TaxID=3075538 RepID=A0ABU2NND9_9ACTN|nr:NADH-quinone oxidoreductase subunit K [Streptomyces sp. DSM 42041]MDT0378280.1 NADH-quinone oxidoreductase subunit K [Streptomyces sp. DSM 42041]
MRTLDVTMALTVGVLFAVGFYLMLQRPLMRIVLGFLVLGHGTNLLLLVAGGGPGRVPVVEGGAASGNLGRFADPLPQALALTSIVITFGLSAFLMALAYRSWRLSGHDEVQDDLEDRLIGTTRERAGEDPALVDVPPVEEGDVPGTDGRRGGQP